MHRDSDVGVFGTSGVDAHVPSHATRNVKPPPDSTTKQPPHPNWETDSVDTEGLLGSTAELAIDLTETDSSSADQSDPRNRAQIGTSSVAPPADATSSETGSVHRESAPTTTDTRTVVTVSNGTVDTDQSGARKRARVDISSTALTANATNSATSRTSNGKRCLVPSTTKVEDVMDITRAAAMQTLDMNLSWRVLKPRIKASKILLSSSLYY